MAAYNWDAIRTEFITKGTSYRKLADKYGPHKDTIWRKARDEEWEDMRRQHVDKTQTEILEADTEQKVSMAEKLNEATDILLGNVVSQMKTRDHMEMDVQEMKDISVVLKNVKDILGIKSKKDLEEQDARIKKLQKEAEQEDTQTDVVITFKSEEEKKWAE